MHPEELEAILEKNLPKVLVDYEKNYRIQVHALKSTSLIIGALKFSEFAKKLEIAAKEENINYIEENHEELMKSYKKLHNEIGEWLKISRNI